ncbi:hypothetical protein GCM10008934_39140 [Virgibacillus salarius]
MLSPSTIDVAKINVLKKKAIKIAIMIALTHSNHSFFFFVSATEDILSRKHYTYYSSIVDKTKRVRESLQIK